MALDAQGNWNVEMSQPLRLQLQQVGEPPSTIAAPPCSSLDGSTLNCGREILLPSEIVAHIVSFLPRIGSQGTLWACTLVSRVWYTSSIALLYEHPYLDGSRFEAFVRTVCPSKNAHIKQSSLSVLVKSLDMSSLVHNSSRSQTARLLGRLKGNIVKFVAPQSSFAINSFASLSKCSNLKVLNLSLISASISLKILFQTLRSLQQLETLFFPRTSGSDQGSKTSFTTYPWPPKLKALHLAGGVDDMFMIHQMRTVPDGLEKLSIQHCAQVHSYSLIPVLKHVGPKLRHLTIRYPMPHFDPGSLDTLLNICPKLVALRVSADYISDDLLAVEKHPLRILDIESSPAYMTNEVSLTAGRLYQTVEVGDLPDLRSVRITKKLGWKDTPTSQQDVYDLAEAMEDHDEEDPLGIPIGVWHCD
ncbi:hypothetical protein HYFRA_00007792 [Hymenoscyphus fraxineus]|uniref:F-box domain-containing protein n=1 Tax=Hymenoscyphus fraxineus TaxID=746836 RepID=A0A9N9KKT9_9HELO|nr:hypothetical protein HYFRA_00007792 [Hymenoscyphus fraxineus]